MSASFGNDAQAIDILANWIDSPSHFNGRVQQGAPSAPQPVTSVETDLSHPTLEATTQGGPDPVAGEGGKLDALHHYACNAAHSLAPGALLHQCLSLALCVPVPLGSFKHLQTLHAISITHCVGWTVIISL